MKCHERRSAAPVLDNGIGLLRFKKNTYEADKALERILEVSDVPLVAKPIYGRQVQVATLLGKDAKGEAATFTATMQPPIEPGEEMEIYISCRDLVQMWIVKMFGQAPSKAAPSPYVLVKEKLENGKWVEIGRTESIAKDCNPVFSRPVLVTYKGPEAAQQIQINVLSHAFKMRNGMPFGQCTFLLDDLVHARTARVLKLPLLGTAKNKSNGSVIVTGARHEPAEAGMWVQIKLCALHLPWYAEPWYNAAGELNFEARKENTSKIPPNVYFEVWRQSNEGEKPVYRSEVVKGSDPDWCPVALNSRVCAGEDECFWLKLWNQRTSNANETTSSDLLGECRINMHELLARKEFPIFEKWPDKTLAKNSKGQPKFLIQESKWIKLANEAKLECQPVYKKDMDFLKDLMDNLDLDAATKESCQSCLLFVNTRAKFWATEKILSESVKIGAHPIHHDDSFHPSSQSQSVAGAADDTNACSRNESKAARRGSLSLSRQDSKQHSESFMQELPPNAAAYAENYDTAKKFLEEHTPISRRQQSKIWLEELENIQNRCKSRTWSTTRPRSPDAAMGIAVSRLRLGGDVVSSEDGVEGLTPRTRSCSSPFKDTLRPERKSATSAGNRRHSQARRGSIVSDLTDSLDLHNRSLLSSSVVIHTLSHKHTDENMFNSNMHAHTKLVHAQEQNTNS